ncbi:flavin-containing monooxygenase FMO GS-OX-like 8 [Cajanus cajan]|uniref:Flavin-containing monooxygenase n=1 Tax=Cajanus cajan TaxID=3821 RepID=A0A151SKX5_CAJCA|nr:flavin-containing monooxygenase FMO GS-OX-like 8 [Cajanus cajan]KYP55470.1 Flavin-containing monooxygenase FMO GS-OX3 [Cajanus cajan]
MMVSETRVESKMVCVIGAGPSGLVAARELVREGHKVVVLEQNRDIGGQWLYDPNVQHEDPLGANPWLKVHSSIYHSLRLMSPREVMGFTDFPFLVKKGRDPRRFPGHRELLLYLKDFAQWFNLGDIIKFNTKVHYVGPFNYGAGASREDLKWLVRSKENKGDHEEELEQLFDAVVVATGHYSNPRLPSIQGMDTWRRKQMHSHIYRSPHPFRGEIVVVIGNSFSGQEISLELVKVAKEVHLSSKIVDIYEGLSKVISKHDNFHFHPQIDTLQEDGSVIFTDGSKIIADTILYCTGYNYSFPFLDTKGIVVVDDNRVGPLYEHTFPPALAPSLSLVGIPKRILGLPFFESQGKWIAQLLSGKKVLPSYEEMMKSIEEFYHSNEVAGIPKRHTHEIQGFEYCDKYGENVGFPKLEEWRKELCVSAVINLFVNLETYRDSWDDDDKVQEALRSPYFTQLGVELE